MKYTSLKSDIVNILRSSDSDLNLKFYDESGNTTLDTDEIHWIYIFDNNVMVEMMTDSNPTICLWKDSQTINEKMKGIIQRIRELAILNGVSVQIRVYNNLDQRKIYNLIKSSIIANNKEDEEMNESVNPNQSLVEAFKHIVQTAKNTKKPSDFYMSESIQLKNTEIMLKEMIDEIKSLNSLKNMNINESLNSLLTTSSLNDIKRIVENMDKDVVKVLCESASNIKNIGSFVKQKYLNNIPFSNDKPSSIIVLENVKVYSSKISHNKEDLVNAYNKLITVSEGAQTGMDLLRQIKKHKILETYNVAKKDLLDLWLSKDHKPIKEQRAYIIENYDGEKIAFNENVGYSIKALAQYINNGGDKDSQICQNIVMETIKYNNIADFIVQYKDNYTMRGFIPKFKKIFKECVGRLNEANNNFSTDLFEGLEETISYNTHMQVLEESMGVKHPAIKYLAIEEAKKEYNQSRIIMEEKDNDMKILTNELKHYSKFPSVIASLIISEGLNGGKMLTESVNKNSIINIASSLYSNIHEYNDEVSSVVSSALFNIIHTNKKLVESKQDFIKMLLKYSK